ncbi:MAG: ImmA/IrrE family metallo-endopeptidase [Actinomycetaceae bacterium]|nr:ImmA/IrrE family metallo-endopeptidase [Actinomycetaceae bacterium]
MATTVWEAAETAAKKLYANYQTKDGLVDLDAICADYNIKVIHTKRLPDDTSGMIIKKGKDQPAFIYINATESRHRQRFTLAHEIGHFMERKLVAKDPSYSFRDKRGTNDYDLHEFFADQFAGALLMPTKQILKRNPELRAESLSDPLEQSMAAIDVAKQFNVSHAAAEKRLERLVKQGDIPK